MAIESTDRTARAAVPWRTILACIGAVGAIVGALWLLVQVQRVVVWLLVALLLAVVLEPPVSFFVRRLRCRRGTAIAIVYLLGVVLIAGLAFVLFRPAVTEGGHLVDDAPQYVDDLEAGRGPVGELVVRYQLQDRVREVEAKVREGVDQLGDRSIDIISDVGNTVAGVVTVIVLSVLVLLDAPRLLHRIDTLIADHHRDRVRAVAADCSRAVTGYMAGNLAISAIAGVSTAALLWVTGVPYAGTLGVFIAVIDLIPLVGATIGAAVVIVLALFHAPVVALIMLVWFVVYQQVENHVLQPAIQARTVELSPLVVLIAVLLGAELGGLLGALFAIPVAGVVRVLVRDLWEHRRSAGQPSIGADEVPADEAPLLGLLDLRDPPPEDDEPTTDAPTTVEPRDVEDVDDAAEG